jgi:hypothetical protein
MPVTAKLSRRFYETFGDDIVNELVEWLNQVDATYRLELRELNDLNFSRFDAKLEQRVAQLDAKWDQRFARLEANLDQRVAQLDAKWDQRFAQLEARLEQRTAELRSELRAEFREGLAMLEGRMLARFGVIEGRFGTFEGRLLKWMFLFWVGTVGTLVGLLKL